MVPPHFPLSHKRGAGEGDAFGSVWIEGTSGSGAFTIGGVAITAPINSVPGAQVGSFGQPLIFAAGNGSGGSLIDTDSISIQRQAPASAEAPSKHLAESRDDNVSTAFAPADADGFAVGRAADLLGMISLPANLGRETGLSAAFWA